MDYAGSNLAKIDALRRTLRNSSDEANQLGLTFVAYLIDMARTAIENYLPAERVNNSPAKPCSRPSRPGPPSAEGPGS